MRLVRSSYLLCLAQFCATFQTLGIFLSLSLFKFSFSSFSLSPLSPLSLFPSSLFFFFVHKIKTNKIKKGIQNVQRLLRELPHEADEPQLHSAALADRLLVLFRIYSFILELFILILLFVLFVILFVICDLFFILYSLFSILDLYYYYYLCWVFFLSLTRKYQECTNELLRQYVCSQAMRFFCSFFPFYHSEFVH